MERDNEVGVDHQAQVILSAWTMTTLWRYAGLDLIAKNKRTQKEVFAYLQAREALNGVQSDTCN